MALENIRKLLKEKINNPSEQDKDLLSYQFALYKANMRRFLPDISSKYCENSFKKYMYYNANAKLDQNDFQKLETIHLFNNSSFDFNAQSVNPIIFATFHYGSYRMVNAYLIKTGFKIVLIVTQKVYETQKSEINDSYNKYMSFALQNNSDFIILSIADSSSIFRLKDLLQKGYIGVVYLDGNSGMDKEIDFEKNFENINFLQSHIFVKNGIIRLAALLNAVIVPAITEWDNFENVIITLHKETKLSDYPDKQVFISQSLRYLYSMLEQNIKKEPEQWECWTYIHKWFPRNTIASYTETTINNLNWTFNKDRFSLFTVLNEFYIFDMFSYMIYPIDKIQYFKLKNSNIKSTDENIQDLISKNIII